MQTDNSFVKKNITNIVLFLFTILSTFFVGMMLSVTDKHIPANIPPGEYVNIFKVIFQEDIMFSGALFSLAIMSILLAHEMGHYLTCRYYKIDATLPYFIPFPTLIGTMGAFIRIKSPITSRRSLFDIGAAGPISGFILIIPWMYIGLKMSTVSNITGEGFLQLQDPLLTRIILAITDINVPPDKNLIAHPVYIAAWFGCLATAINLIPVGQLDGGHIIYSLFKKQSSRIYKIAFALTVAIAALSFIEEGFSGWILWIVLVYFLMRKGHPPTLNDEIELDRGRKITAIILLIILIVTFMPVPISLS